MTRLPFDPMKSAAMRTAAPKKTGAAQLDAPPLPADQERALIEALADADVTAHARELIALPSGTPTKPLSVGALNALINQLLTGALPETFFVAGELSNFRTYDRGHAFFTLKEAGAELPCVLWKDALARLKFRPKDGMSVIARGAVKLYEPQGKLQLYVESLSPQGTGGLELAFRQLCDKLRAEGLFELARKRPIPRLPQRIVIITSRTGDVLHDVLTTAFRRFPGLHAMLYPVRVQGDQAAQEIAAAIRAINVHHAACIAQASSPNPRAAPSPPPIDLILLVRGGGSLEDLWAFNEEIVARAIIVSRIPIGTGIGHEPDTTIADLVGDLRGPTPTGVTELTIPHVAALSAEFESKAAMLTRDIRRLLVSSRTTVDRTAIELHAVIRHTTREKTTRIDHLRRQVERIEPKHAIAQGWRRIEEAGRKVQNVMAARLRTQRDSVNRIQSRLERTSPLTRIERHRTRVDHLQERLAASLHMRLNQASEKLTALATQLRVVSPQAVLDRGFSITSTASGEIVRSAQQVKKGDLLTTRVADGEFESTVGKPKQATLF